MQREILADGSVQWSDGACSFRFRRLKPGVLLVTISGNDRGQFGTATVDEVTSELTRTTQPLQLFIDTRTAIGPTREVMETWTEWLAANQSRLARVVVLVPPESQLLHLTVSIAQHLSRTGNLIRICGTLDDFRSALSAAAPDQAERLTL